MSDFEVRLRRLSIHPHPNADALELAQPDGTEYRAVVGKGQFATGDLAFYIPEASVLPDDLIDEMGLTGRLAGSLKNRVKAIRLRGELSQGLVYDPGLPRPFLEKVFAAKNPVDFAGIYGIEKYEPVVPASMSGLLQPAAFHVPWGEVENIKSDPSLFEPGENVDVTSKIHGSSFAVSMVKDHAADRWKYEVASKGIGKQGFCFQDVPENNTNVYMQALFTHHEVFEKIAAHQKVSDNFVLTIYGEVYGRGVQDMAYDRPKGRHLRIFDVRLTDTYGESTFLPMWEWASSVPEDMRVPAVFSGPYDQEFIEKLAEAPDPLTGGLQEGVVVRALNPRRIAKFVNPAYLTRKGGTDYS